MFPTTIRDSNTLSVSVSLPSMKPQLPSSVPFRTSLEPLPISVPVTLMTAHSQLAVLVYATGTSTGMKVSTSARGAHTGAIWDVTATECAKHPNLTPKLSLIFSKMLVDAVK